MMKLLNFTLLIFVTFSLIACGKKSDEYTDELPPVDNSTGQTIDTVDHSSANVKDPVFQQKN